MVESKSGFSAAARHLFRHLDEPHKLRGNALARRFLIDLQTGGFTTLSERRGSAGCCAW